MTALQPTAPTLHVRLRDGLEFTEEDIRHWADRGHGPNLEINDDIIYDVVAALSQLVLDLIEGRLERKE